MSHPGKFIKKHPWEAAGMAAAAGLGGAGLAGMGPMAGLLGAGAAPATLEAGAALPGASGLVDLAGATGAPLASTPSVMPPVNFSGGLKGLAMANKAGGLMGMNAKPPPMAQNTIPSPPVQNTVLPAVQGQQGMAGMDPKTLEMLMRLLQQQQGGMA